MSHSTGTGHAMLVDIDSAVDATELHLTLPQFSAARIEALMDVTGANGPRDVLGAALRIYEALVHAERDGARPLVRYANGSEVDVFTTSASEPPPPPIHDIAALAERLEAVALGIERGERAPHSAGRELRVIAGKLREVVPR